MSECTHDCSTCGESCSERQEPQSLLKEHHPETPVFTGGERIMRKMNNAVFYVEMSRPKRGYYTATYKLITREPNSLPEHEITRRFFQMLEETIRKNPPYYLWTHNRWKRTREEFDKRYEIKNGKVIPKES